MLFSAFKILMVCNCIIKCYTTADFINYFHHQIIDSFSPHLVLVLIQVAYCTLRDGYMVLINTWRRNSLLKKAVAHYASCPKTDAIHVVWSENDPPPESLKTYLRNIIMSRSRNSQKPKLQFDLNEEDNLNNRFKPINGLTNDAIFSVDDDLLVPCSTLEFAFTVWQTTPDTMVGFVPRMHWLDEEVSHLLFRVLHFVCNRLEDQVVDF